MYDNFLNIGHAGAVYRMRVAQKAMELAMLDTKHADHVHNVKMRSRTKLRITSLN